MRANEDSRGQKAHRAFTARTQSAQHTGHDPRGVGEVPEGCKYAIVYENKQKKTDTDTDTDTHRHTHLKSRPYPDPCMPTPAPL